MGTTTQRHRAVVRLPPSSALLTTLLLLASLLTPAGLQAQQAPLEVRRLAGATRVATAATVSQQTHPRGSGTVVIARADGYADALAGAPLAAAIGAPVLLTRPDRLDADAAAEVSRLGATEAVLLGDLSPTVAGELLEAGVSSIARLRGPDAATTLSLIAASVIAQTGARQALLVEGSSADPQRGWPDALAASAWAAREGLPILMTTAEGLPPSTAAALSSLDLDGLTIVGGLAAVPQAVEDAAAAILRRPIDRVAGASRYDTALAVARRMLDDQGYTRELWVASGASWPDALVAGPAIAASGGVLLLADPQTMRRSPQTLDFIDEQRGHARRATLVGGTAVLSPQVQDSVTTGVLEDPPGPEALPPPTTGDGGARPPGPGLPALPPPIPARNTAPPLSPALLWSDPATWGGAVPTAGSTVTIPADAAILLDVQPPALRGIQVNGTLVVADVDMTIEADWIVVAGRLAIGTAERPLTRRVTVVLHPRHGDDIAGAGSGPIAVDGGTLDIHGITPEQTWTRLASTAVAGSSTLTLQQPPGWQAGDAVVVAATGLDPDQAEQRTVTGVSGAEITLDRPLSHTHWGQTDVLADAAVSQHAEVGSLTRNVVIRTAEDARAELRGGHIIGFEGSVLRISGAELIGMGQAGVLARYPIHFHMMGSAAGSWVRGVSIHHSASRCLTIHGTDDVEVTDTIGYETFGHCFFFEDGAETGNQLRCNLGLSTRVPADAHRLLPTDETPATYWVTNPSNHLVDNAAAGTFGHGFWYDLPEAPTGLSTGRAMDIRRLPFGTFADNVAHTAVPGNFKRGTGLFVEDYHPPGAATIERFLAYANGGFGIWAEGVDVVDAVLAGNDVGFLGLRASLRSSTVVGETSNAADQPWRMTGVGFYHGRSAINDVTFVNFSRRAHDWQHPALAMEFISRENNQVSEVTGARYVNASRLQISDPDDDGDPDRRTAAIRDLDGSVSGAPALLTSAHPLMTDPSCPWRADLAAHACPVTHQRTWLMVRDIGDDALRGAWLTRQDGVEAPMHSGDHEPDRAHVDLLANRGYRLRTGDPTPAELELILAGDQEAHLDLQIPWPHAQAHLYDGWGRWHEVPRVASLSSAADTGFLLRDGVLHVRHTLDDLQEKGQWQRLEVCATAFCGAAGPG